MHLYDMQIEYIHHHVHRTKSYIYLFVSTNSTSKCCNYKRLYVCEYCYASLFAVFWRFMQTILCAKIS